MHTGYCYKHTIHEMTGFFLDEVIFFNGRLKTTNSNSLQNRLKRHKNHVLNSYIYHPQIKGHNLSFINS